MKALRSGGGATAIVVICLAILFLLPKAISEFGVMQATLFAAMAVFGLSQGFVWGFAGILSFGQAAFLGIGAYTYAVVAMNIGDTTSAILLALIVPMLFAALLGYFMFYGRISDAYIGVITLTVSVILFELMNSTSGSAYHIGSVALGGFNGIPAIPPITPPGKPDEPLDQDGIWYVAMSAVIIVYVFLKGVLASRFGRVVIAIRENETRAMLIGYDPRLYKLVAFVIGAAIAGAAGALFATWGGFISPTVFALTMSAQVIIAVLIGGLGTLIGPILGAVAIQYLINLAGTQHVIDPSLGLGIVLVAFVLLVPQGVVPVFQEMIGRWRGRHASSQSGIGSVKKISEESRL
ncbi:urea ABC transporter [Robbsia andropogonis]|uniref:Urea ABC transporter n=1 Tax=Robbsia andropogonis TaxID=28092 RepID=A0A0F5K0N4_9BURK|nr:urea ABC transporter [Robbsia andropogonis]KKB63444.1 urea ABC transporter [Robbsia andropogonis]MCP1120412.1 branched-chain amino acid ABC transporter permease [Robbsia andropogonis]MCP1130234.1 branched-chain amino acid ABC transporter permease [Robbsia andropogonis]